MMFAWVPSRRGFYMEKARWGGLTIETHPTAFILRIWDIHPPCLLILLSISLFPSKTGIGNHGKTMDISMAYLETITNSAFIYFRNNLGSSEQLPLGYHVDK